MRAYPPMITRTRYYFPMAVVPTAKNSGSPPECIAQRVVFLGPKSYRNDQATLERSRGWCGILT